MGRPVKSPAVFGSSATYVRQPLSPHAIRDIQVAWGVKVTPAIKQRIEEIAGRYIRLTESETTQKDLEAAARKIAKRAQALHEVLASDAGYAVMTLADNKQDPLRRFVMSSIEWLESLESEIGNVLKDSVVMREPSSQLAFELAQFHAKCAGRLPSRSIDWTKESAARNQGEPSFSGLVQAFGRVVEQLGAPYAPSTLARKVHEHMNEIVGRLEDDASSRLSKKSLD